MPKASGPKVTKKSKPPRKSDFSIFLLKKDFVSPEALLRTETFSVSKVSYEGIQVGTLYTKSKPPTSPAWMKNFAEADLNPQPKLTSASSSAVFVVEAAGRTFALTYGYGRAMLNDDAWEQDFGLKVVLNSVDPQKIRQIERSSFDSLLQNTSSQSVREAPVDEFGLDVEQDVIRSIRGTSKLSELGVQIRGRDSLHLHVATPFDQVQGILQAAAEQFKKKDYKKIFPFIDKMAEVRAKNEIDHLDAELVARMRAGDAEKLWMAIPDIIYWQDGSHLTYSRDTEDIPRDDLLLSDYRGLFQNPESISLDILKGDRVFLHVSEGPVAQSWRVYKCLYCEVEKQKTRFILNNGKWYRVDEKFAEEVQEFYSAIPSTKVELPKYSQKSEGEYNQAASTGKGYCLMDKKLISIPARGRIQIEFCDLYDKDGKIIHVKRYSGSSELSHLFAQGLVSGELFLESSDFREEVNAKLSDDCKIQNVKRKPDAAKYEIVFAIISSSTKPGRKNIPFFSQVNLRNVVQRLTGRGYNVTLADVRHD